MRRQWTIQPTWVCCWALLSPGCGSPTVTPVELTVDEPVEETTHPMEMTSSGLLDACGLQTPAPLGYVPSDQLPWPPITESQSVTTLWPTIRRIGELGTVELPDDWRALAWLSVEDSLGIFGGYAVVAMDSENIDIAEDRPSDWDRWDDDWEVDVSILWLPERGSYQILANRTVFLDSWLEDDYYEEVCDGDAHTALTGARLRVEEDQLLEFCLPSRDWCDDGRIANSSCVGVSDFTSDQFEVHRLDTGHHSWSDPPSETGNFGGLGVSVRDVDGDGTGEVIGYAPMRPSRYGIPAIIPAIRIRRFQFDEESDELNQRPLWREALVLADEIPAEPEAAAAQLTAALQRLEHLNTFVADDERLDCLRSGTKDMLTRQLVNAYGQWGAWEAFRGRWPSGTAVNFAATYRQTGWGDAADDLLGSTYDELVSVAWDSEDTVRIEVGDQVVLCNSAECVLSHNDSETRPHVIAPSAEQAILSVSDVDGTVAFWFAHDDVENDCFSYCECYADELIEIPQIPTEGSYGGDVFIELEWECDFAAPSCWGWLDETSAVYGSFDEFYRLDLLSASAEPISIDDVSETTLTNCGLTADATTRFLRAYSGSASGLWRVDMSSGLREPIRVLDYIHPQRWRERSFNSNASLWFPSPDATYLAEVSDFKDVRIYQRIDSDEADALVAQTHAARPEEPATRTGCPEGQHLGGTEGCMPTGLCEDRYTIDGRGECVRWATWYTSPVPALGDHFATSLTDGRSFATGPIQPNDDADPYQGAYVYSNYVWNEVAPDSQPRFRAAGANLLSGGVLLTGGFALLHDASTSCITALPTAVRYDLLADTWVTAGELAVGRYEHSATLLHDGRVLVVGGRSYGDARMGCDAETASSVTDSVLDSAESFDPVTSTWQSTEGMMYAARYAHTATRLEDGRVLVAGGRGQMDQLLAGVEIFDPASNTFIPGPDLTWPRYGHVAVLLNDGRVLVTGGGSPAELFDPITAVWIPLEDGPTATWSSAARVDDGRVAVTGGTGSSGDAASAGVYWFDPTTQTWAHPYTTFRGRIGHSSIVLPTGRLLQLGGYERSGRLGLSELSEAIGVQPSRIAEMILVAEGTIVTAFTFNSGPATLATGRGFVVGEGSDGFGLRLSGDGSFSAQLNLIPRTGEALRLFNGRSFHVGGCGSPPQVVDQDHPYPEGFSERHGTAPALLREGQVLLAGGRECDNTASPLQTSVIFDPWELTFSEAPNLLFPVGDPMAASLEDGRVLLVSRGATQVFSEETGWELGPPLPAEIEPLGLWELRQGRVLLHGDSEEACLLVLDAGAASWRPIAQGVSCPAEGFQLDSGDLLFFGSRPGEANRRVLTFDSATERLYQTAQLPYLVSDIQFIELANGTAMVAATEPNSGGVMMFQWIPAQ